MKELLLITLDLIIFSLSNNKGTTSFLVFYEDFLIVYRLKDHLLEN